MEVTRTSSEQYASQQDLPMAGQYLHLHYQADRPIVYDLSFRRFVTTALFDRAILVPVRSGSGRKLTVEGVVKVAYGHGIPCKTQYQESFLHWSAISSDDFEYLRKSSATKVYFRGFPLETTQDEVTSVFSKFGPIQYVYVMNDSSHKKRSNKQGYIIYEQRHSLERLLDMKYPLSFKGSRIHFEEYKSKNSVLLKEDLKTPVQTESLKGNFPVKFCYQYPAIDTMATLGSTPYEVTPMSTFSPLKREASFLESKQAIGINKNAPTGFSYRTQAHATQPSSLRPFLRFAKAIDKNSDPCSDNLRFNEPRFSQAAQANRSQCQTARVVQGPTHTY